MISALIAAATISTAAPDYAAMMKNLHVPGVEVVIVDRGKIVRNAAYGVKNIATKTPVDIHTRFEIGSITKQFTAAAILQLREQGKLSLDDRLGKYIPQYVNGRTITLRQMLLQISGIPDYTETRAFGKLIIKQHGRYVLSKPGNLEAVIGLIQHMKLNFTPGSKWAYSNTNYYFLGEVVQKVSKQPWSAYVAEHIFKPAGMTDSSFMEDEPGIADMATAYIFEKGREYPTGTFYGWANGAGAIVSTATDLAKWDAALFAGKIVSQSDLALMTAPGKLVAFGKDAHYGFGWMIDTYDGQPRIWHNGGTLAFNSSNYIFPAQQQRIIVLASGNGADTIAQRTFDALHPQFAALEAKPASGEDPAISSRAKSIWHDLTQGHIDRTQFNDAMNKHFTDAYLATIKQETAPFGDPVSWVYKGKAPDKGGFDYTYAVTFKSGMTATLVMTLDAAGKVSSYAVSPGQ